MYKKYIKRLLDILISMLGIVVFTPIYLLISVMVLVTMGRPVLFSQDRIGKNEKIFKLYKFRTMTNERDIEGNLLEEDKRLTKMGAFLRSTSLDELPELFSILKGEMSIIGPRPLPVYYNPYFRENERQRHQVRGGLLPPDSLSGKAFTEWEEQFEYEIYYANNVSFLLDLQILVKTFEILIQRFKQNYGSEFRPHLNVYRKEE